MQAALPFDCAAHARMQAQVKSDCAGHARMQSAFPFDYAGHASIDFRHLPRMVAWDLELNKDTFSHQYLLVRCTADLISKNDSGHLPGIAWESRQLH